RRTDQQNIALLQFDVLELALRVDALVVVIDGYRQRFLRLILADDILVDNDPDVLRLRDILQIELFFRTELLFDDLRAQLNAFIAYIDARTGYELARLVLRFAAEGAFQL